MLTFAAMVVLALLGHAPCGSGWSIAGMRSGFRARSSKAHAAVLRRAFRDSAADRLAQHSIGRPGVAARAGTVVASVPGVLRRVGPSDSADLAGRQSRWRRLPGGVSRGDDYVVDLVRHLGSSPRAGRGHRCCPGFRSTSCGSCTSPNSRSIVPALRASWTGCRSATGPTCT